MKKHELCDPLLGLGFFIWFTGLLECEHFWRSHWLCEGLCRWVGQKEFLDDLGGLQVVVELNVRDGPTRSAVQG
jgi:hypothetical protein